MRILMYSSGATDAGKEAGKKFRTCLNKYPLECFASVENLISEIRHSRQGVAALVLIAATSHELSALIDVRPLLGDLPIVLLIHDRSQKTFAGGFKLIPRFVEDLNAKGTAACEVIQNIIENRKKTVQGWRGYARPAEKNVAGGLLI